MSDQETYSPQVDAPAAAPVAGVPNEAYYRAGAPQQRGGRTGLGVALVVVGLLLLAFQVLGRGLAIGGGGTISLVDEQRPGSRVELSVAASDVEVHTWDGNQIKIEATQHGGSRGDYQVNVDTSGDTVRVTEESSSLFCWFCSRGVSYRISVPQNGEASITTASGDIDIDGLRGAVALGTASGDVRAEDLQGGLKVNTTSGEVRLNNVAGTLEIGTISGDIELGDGKVTSATINTTSGEVDLDGVAGPLQVVTISGDITIQDASDAQLNLSSTSGEIEYSGSLRRAGNNTVNTISGNVQLALPGDSSFKLDASTVSGEISSEFALEAGESGRRNLNGIAGGGDAVLTVGTTSGDISIEAR